MAATRDEMIAIFADCKRAYQLAFNSDAGKAVLADLAPFCRANEVCVAAEKGQPVDVYRTFINEGRREVYLRFIDYLELTPEQLVDKFTRPATGAQGQ